MPPLLQRLSERRPEALDYLGTSYGLTPSLFKFWKKSGFVPLYLRQTTNDLTGEHSCVMLRGLASNRDVSAVWLGAFARDFRTRWTSLLGFDGFRKFSSVTALSVLEATSSADLVSQESGQSHLRRRS